MSPCLRRGTAAGAAVKLVTTSVVRGSYQGESHGGVYLIDLEKREVRQTIDWNKADIDWQGRGWDRGLRGIAFDGETVYIAASDELFAYTPDFQPLGSWRNPYLKHCHEISVWERRLFLTSTGFDSILGFDLDRREFSWAMHVATHQISGSRRSTFDPRGKDGPLMLNKLHVNNVHCTQGRHVPVRPAHGRHAPVQRPRGADVGRAAGGLAQCAAVSRRRAVQRYRGGCPALCRARRGIGGPRLAASRVTIPPRSRTTTWTKAASPARALRAGSACCPTRVVAGRFVAVDRFGVRPAANRRLLSVNLTMDVRNAIHGLEVWPYG